jgi:RNA polymerase sigma-70 factor (ECF subfamily)
MAGPYVELERRVKEDPEAFRLLYQMNRDRVFNYILHTTRDIELSFDLTSETFLKALIALPKYEYRGVSFTAWLLGIASREIATFYRKQKRSKTINMSLLPHADEIGAIRQAVSDEEVRRAQVQIESCEDFVVISPFLRDLPEAHREVIFLRFFEGLSAAETARVLNRPVATVRSQIDRGLKRLRRAMESREISGHTAVRAVAKPSLTSELREEVD